MQCDNCKDREATVHYQQNIDDKVTEIHLCDKCASEKGMISFNSEKPMNFGNLLAGFLDDEASETSSKEKKVRCKCGWSNIDLKKTGFLGCPQCYKTFNKSLTPLLRRIHGSNKHTGKAPKKITFTEKVTERDTGTLALKKHRKLKDELDLAIKEERYEDAAKIRDQVKKLEDKINQEE